MKRLINFARLDIFRLVKLKTLWLFLFAPLLVLIIAARHYSYDSDDSIFAFCYSMLLGMILATTSFKSDQKAEQGFFKMLPAKPGEQVAGHYISGAVIILLGFLLGLADAFLPFFIFKSREATDISSSLPLFFVIFCVSLIVMSLEGILLTFFRFKSAKADAWLRAIPAIIFYAFIMSFSSDRQNIISAQETLSSAGFSGGLAVPTFIVSVILFFVLMRIAMAISARRE